MAGRRVRSTRGLWDPTYTGAAGGGAPGRLIPRMRAWAALHCPGTKPARRGWASGAATPAGRTVVAPLAGGYGTPDPRTGRATTRRRRYPHAALYFSGIVGDAATIGARRMKYMLLFLLACIVLGLWGPTKKQFTAIVAVLAVLLVVFFYLQPAKM